MSKVASGKGRPLSMLAVWKVRFLDGFGEVEASELACAITASETSTPVTEPWGTKAQNPDVIVPGPQPMSRILSCGLMCGRRNAASLVAVREEWERVTDSW